MLVPVPVVVRVRASCNYWLEWEQWITFPILGRLSISSYLQIQHRYRNNCLFESEERRQSWQIFQFWLNVEMFYLIFHSLPPPTSPLSMFGTTKISAFLTNMFSDNPDLIIWMCRGTSAPHRLCPWICVLVAKRPTRLRLRGLEGRPFGSKRHSRVGDRD